MGAELIRSGMWFYRGLNGLGATRWLRLYRRTGWTLTEPDRLVAVLTEQGEGPSITNCVAEIHRALRSEYLSYELALIEHYPAAGDGAGANAEHFDLVTSVTPTQWRRLTPLQLVEMVGEDLHGCPVPDTAAVEPARMDPFIPPAWWVAQVGALMRPPDPGVGELVDEVRWRNYVLRVAERLWRPAFVAGAVHGQAVALAVKPARIVISDAEMAQVRRRFRESNTAGAGTMAVVGDHSQAALEWALSQASLAPVADRQKAWEGAAAASETDT